MPLLRCRLCRPARRSPFLPPSAKPARRAMDVEGLSSLVTFLGISVMVLIVCYHFLEAKAPVASDW